MSNQREQGKFERLQEGDCHSAYCGRMDGYKNEQTGKYEASQKLAEFTNQERRSIPWAIHEQVKSKNQKRSCVALVSHWAIVRRQVYN